MGKLKALLFTQGMHGMISQVEGMAKALNAQYSHKIVRLSFPWNLVPPKFTPIYLLSSLGNIRTHFFIWR